MSCRYRWLVPAMTRMCPGSHPQLATVSCLLCALCVQEAVAGAMSANDLSTLATDPIYVSCASVAAAIGEAQIAASCGSGDTGGAGGDTGGGDTSPSCSDHGLSDDFSSTMPDGSPCPAGCECCRDDGTCGECNGYWVCDDTAGSTCVPCDTMFAGDATLISTCEAQAGEGFVHEGRHYDNTCNSWAGTSFSCPAWGAYIALCNAPDDCAREPTAEEVADFCAEFQSPTGTCKDDPNAIGYLTASCSAAVGR